MKTFTATQLKSIRSLAAEFHLELVLLFGSRARGKAHETSDVDLAVLAAHRLTIKEFLALQGRLQDIIGIPVDLVDLKTAPVLLGDRITRDAMVIVGNTKTFSRLRSKLHIRYMDFQPIFQRQQDRLYRQFGVTQ